MASRMSKYNNDEFETLSRLEKNENLYKDLYRTELENFDISSNATILGENNEEINVEKIKAILDTRYKEVPKRRSIRLEEETEPYFEEDITKEYDINAILNKAREDKPVVYEEERAKKLRDTQYDILKQINVVENAEKNEEDLQNLINTITLNESKTLSDSTGLFSDLKGDSKTEVFEEIKKEDKKEDKKIEQTFFSDSTQFSTKDFESLDVDRPKKNKVKEFLIILILFAFIAGVVVFVKSILG